MKPTEAHTRYPMYGICYELANSIPWCCSQFIQIFAIKFSHIITSTIDKVTVISVGNVKSMEIHMLTFVSQFGLYRKVGSGFFSMARTGVNQNERGLTEFKRQGTTNIKPISSIYSQLTFPGLFQLV